MRKHTVLLFVLVFVVNLGTFAAGASKTTHELKLSYQGTPDSVEGRAVSEFASYVESATDGKVKIVQFPGGVMGSHSEVLDLVREGVVELSTENPARMSLVSSVREAAVFDAPFIYNSIGHMREFCRSETVQDWAKTFLRETGIRWLVTDGLFGTRHLSTSRVAVRHPDDMRGLKIRTPELPVRMDMVRAWGGDVVTSPTAEMYLAMQTGLASGQESPLWWQAEHKYWEVQDYVTLTGHVIMPLGLIINEEAFGKLDAQSRDALLKGARIFADRMTELATLGDEIAVAELEANGMVVIRDVDIPAFQERTAIVWERYSDRWGAGTAEAVARQEYVVLSPDKWQAY